MHLRGASFARLITIRKVVTNYFHYQQIMTFAMLIRTNLFFPIVIKYHTLSVQQFEIPFQNLNKKEKTTKQRSTIQHANEAGGELVRAREGSKSSVQQFHEYPDSPP